MTPCCGNCKWWEGYPPGTVWHAREGESEIGECIFPVMEILPASVTRSCMVQSEGADCPTFAAKEQV